MTRFAVPLQELESVRVDPAELLEESDVAPAPSPDARGEQPDRDWFAAGG